MSYNGLCVGGPADGKIMAQQRTSFRATEREAYGMVEGTQEPLYHTTEYKWLSLNKQVSLWTPVGQSLDETMLLLATHYKPETADVG